MPTPPPFYNVASQPDVHSDQPLWDTPGLGAELAAGRGWLAGAAQDEQQSLATHPVSAEPTHVVRLPKPSWLPLLCGLAVGSVFLALLFKVYALAPFGALAALVLFWRWAWSIGLKADPAAIDIGRGVALPPHDVAERAPGRAGMQWTLVADGAFFVSLLFGYAYLTTVAPGWPPPDWLAPAPWSAALAIALLLFTCAAMRRAAALNLAGDSRACRLGLAAVIAGGIAATAAIAASVLPGLPSPREHAYGAIVAFMLVYAVVHTALGTVFAAYAWARARSGFVSGSRQVEMQVSRLWWDYSAATGAMLLVAIHVPAWLAGGA